jgi:hypothetical protein
MACSLRLSRIILDNMTNKNVSIEADQCRDPLEMASSISDRESTFADLGTMPFKLLTDPASGISSNLPLSWTTKSNLVPGTIRSFLLASTGMVTCPLEVTVDVIQYKTFPYFYSLLLQP